MKNIFAFKKCGKTSYLKDKQYFMLNIVNKSMKY